MLDLSAIRAGYTEKRGYPLYDPRLMLRLLIYGYTTGVRSSRAIERNCADDITFRFLAADQEPDFRSISRFRRRHLDALTDLFTQSLQLAQRLGLVKMGCVALDGLQLPGDRAVGEAVRRRDHAPGPQHRPYLGLRRSHRPHESLADLPIDRHRNRCRRPLPTTHRQDHGRTAVGPGRIGAPCRRTLRSRCRTTCVSG